MALDVSESQEVQGATARLERELQMWPDLDPQMRRRIQDAIAHTRNIDALTQQRTTEELQREVNSLETSLADLRRGGSRMGGMERGRAAFERVPEINIARERERIQGRLEQLSAHPLSREQIGLLRLRVGELDALERPIPPGEIASHSDFERAIRSAFRSNLSSWGRMFETEDRILALAREGYVRAQNATSNPFGAIIGQRLRMNKRDAYARLLEAGVIANATNVARRAIYSQRVPNPTNIEPILNVAPAAGAVPAVEPPAAGPLPQPAEPARPQEGGNVAADDPNLVIQQLREEIAKLKADRGGGSREGYGNVNITIGDVAAKNSAGGAGTGVMPGTTVPVTPRGHAPESHAGGTHEAQSHGPAQNEAERQRLRNQYSQLEQQQDALVEQLLHIGDNEGKKAREEIGARFKALREQQKGVVRALFGSDIYTRIQAEREAGVSHAPHAANQSPGFQGREGQPAHAPTLSNAVHLPEAHSASPTMAEANNAVAGVSEVTAHRRRDYERWARVVAGKDDPDRVRRWMSAPKRWFNAFVREIPTGFTAVKAGLGGTALASWLGAPAWLVASPAWASVTVPLLGTLAAPGAAALLGGIAGAVLWKATGHKWLGLNELENLANKGWQANKLMRDVDMETKRGLRKGYTPNANRIYESIRTRPQWKRMELIPRLLGGAVGGYVGYDTVAALRRGRGALQSLQQGVGNLYNQGFSGTYHRGLGAWETFRGWLSNLFSAGPTIDPRCGAGDHAAVWQHWDALQRPNVPQPNIPQPNVPQPNIPEPNIPQPNIPQANIPQPNVPQPNIPQPNVPQPNTELYPAAPQANPDVDGPSLAPAPQPAPPQPQPAPLPEPPQPYQSWRAFTGNPAIQNPSGGFEALVRSIPTIDVSELNFGTGNPSVATDIFRRIMYETPDAWQTFFGQYVPGSGRDAFEYAATRLPTGRTLDYSVLSQTYGSSNSIIERMIERAQSLGERGEAAVQAFEHLRDALAQANDARLRVRISR